MTYKTFVMLSVLCFVLCAAGAAAAESYTEFYGDFVSDDFIGVSTLQDLKAGVKNSSLDYYVFVRNEYYNAHGTAVPYGYSLRGFRLGAGARHWFPGDKMFGGVSAARIVSGSDSGKTDFRAGLAGYDELRCENRLTEIYGEVFYVSLAEDCVATVRVRNGKTGPDGNRQQPWLYVVGQVWKSATGENSAENRIELGMGTAIKLEDWGSVNLELRGGYAFSGSVTERAYINPVFIVSGGFRN